MYVPLVLPMVNTVHFLSKFSALVSSLQSEVLQFMDTVFIRLGVAATIYFITQFCAASIQEWLLFESGAY